MSNPVIIVEYDPYWKILFKNERDLITASIGEYINRIEHTGSTSVEGLASKPIIDITIGLRKLSDAVFCIPKLEELNYQYRPEFEDALPMRRYFCKPPRGSGVGKFHIHMVETGCDFWNDHMDFRDYLRKCKMARDNYAKLKFILAEKFKDNRTAYTDAKTEFILNALKEARV